MVRPVRVIAGVLICVMASACAAQGEEAHIAEVKKYIASEVAPWLREAVLLKSLRARNVEHRALTDVDIENLDQEWIRQADAPGKPLIDGVMNNELSSFLQAKIADSQGYIAQIIVMDAKGLNAGLGLVTEDYWQGDEVKWQKGFKARYGEMFVSAVQKSLSAKLLAMEVSLPIEDPDSGETIGAIAVFIDVDHLSSTQ